MKLKNNLYRLRQSPRNWFKTFNDSLKGMGLTLTSSDPCVHIFGSDDTISILTM